MQPLFKQAAVLDLLLYRDNPRHVSKENQEEVIEYLLENEEVYNLARHISANGVNPLEVVAVFSDEDGNLIVAEGNRRVCAAQLLTDPEKAPESARARFRAFAGKSRDVSQINVMEFDDYATAQPWLQVLHDGEQDGVGRRRWKPDQKARATTNKSTNALAVALLDYAEQQGIISGEMRRKIPVSTATRYLANPKVRQAMGLASSATSDEIIITTDVENFSRIISHFIQDLNGKKLHSRSITRDWLAYADELEATFNATLAPITPVPITPVEIRSSAAASERPRKTVRPTRAKIVTPETKFIARSASLIDSLNRLGSLKLSGLYQSLTSIRLDEHPALLTTGAWVFVENLTALHGRNPNIDFVSYLNSKFSGWGITRDQGKDCKLSLEYISQHGNAQKHSATFTAVDARNLNNHFEILSDLFTGVANDCIIAKRAKKP